MEQDKITSEDMETIFPIDTPFWKGAPAFTDCSLVISWETLQFFMEKTSGRYNFVYYLHILTMLTSGHKSEMKRGIKVETHACEAQLSVTSLESIWGIKRKQGRNLLDRMEHLGLIKRTSDNVSSVVNVTNIWGIYDNTGCHQNPLHIRRLHDLKLQNDQTLAKAKAEAKAAASVKAEDKGESQVLPDNSSSNETDKPQTVSESQSEALSDALEPTNHTSDVQ